MADLIRLNKVLRELNLSIDRAVDFLESKGITVEKSPNTKISEEVYKMLLEEFQVDALKRRLALKVRETTSQDREALRESRERDIQERILKEKNRTPLSNRFAERPKQVGKIDLDPRKRDSISQNINIKTESLDKQEPVTEHKKGERLIYLKDFLKGYDVSEAEAITSLINEDFEIDLSVPEIVISITQLTSLQTSFKNKRNNNKLDFEIQTSYQKVDGPKVIGQKVDLTVFHKRLENNIESTATKDNYKRKRSLRNALEKPYDSKVKAIWSSYILAQQKILEYKSLPIAINDFTPAEIIGNRIKLSVDQEIFKKTFKTRIETVFKLDNFDFSKNYILQDLEITDNIDKEELLKIKEEAQDYYIEFNEKPVIDGEITSKQNIKHRLEEIVGKLPTNYKFKSEGLLFLTLEEKLACEKLDFVEFDEKAGAVYQMSPSIKNFILKFNNSLQLRESDSQSLTVEGYLDKRIVRILSNIVRLQITKHDLHFKIVGVKDVGQIWKNLEDRGIELPYPVDDTFSFSYYPNSVFIADEEKTGSEYREVVFGERDFDLRSKMIRLHKTLTRFFPNTYIDCSFSTHYKYDYEMLREMVYDKLHGDQIQVSRSKNTISFDFKNEKELKFKLNELKAVPYLGLIDYDEDHKFKYNIKFKTGLHELRNNLRKELPNLSTHIVANGAKLIFRQFYKSGTKDFIRDYLNDKLRDFVDTSLFEIKTNNTFQEKFLCEENFELKVEQEDEKLSKLVREEFYFGNRNMKWLLGKLQRVDYPNLEFFVDEEQLEEVERNIRLNGVKAIFPNLKGEQDKIIRLSDTIKKLESENELPNNNIKQFLFDSSKAKPIENIDYLLHPSSDEWKEFDKNLFSKQLNESQKQAVFKSLYAEELALIQGPPGTGKSTAIAEIIWQHIRKNQSEKILLTSETNLAVDNAIDRLKNCIHNVVKPIRFGNDEKLESEGRFYSITSIENWANLLESDEENAVSHWVSNISNRVTQHDNAVINFSLSKWKSILNERSKQTRSRFVEKYIEHANLIGATGSSIGKFNSEQRFTSFFRSYLNVFEREKYLQNIKACNNVNIVFDTIIMDEASKATPPELALPLIYGKKAIIVGDHRQLPPMVDGEEIKDTLISIGEKSLARTLSRTEFDKSQFENLFERIDSSIKGTFNTQYRMHPAINDVIKQFYVDDGGLNCGLPLDEISHGDFENPASRYHGLIYKEILNPENHVLWINVDTPEIKEGTSRVNFGEIDAINNILKVIKRSDGINEYNNWLTTQSIEEKQIGVISFYGKQVNYLKRMLKENHEDVPIRLSTVDRFQGMERNIIIVSLVRSNTIATSKDQEPNKELYGEKGYPLQTSLGFAESPNRLNVALSRARRLLVIVGNKEHFSTKNIYKNAVNTIISSEGGKVIESSELAKILNENGK